MSPPADGISAVMAAYNAESYVEAAVQSMLDQTLPPSEIIVVNDGSTDGTAERLARFGDRISVFTQSNGGQTSALIRAVAACTGAFLAFNDADDLWTPDRLRIQRDHLMAHPELEAVFGVSEQFVSPELGLAEQDRYRPAQERIAGELAQTLLIRHDAFLRIGTFNPSYPGVGQVEWFARAKRLSLRYEIMDMVVHRRRLHAGNYGRTQTGERDRQMLDILRRHMRAAQRP